MIGGTLSVTMGGSRAAEGLTWLRMSSGGVLALARPQSGTLTYDALDFEIIDFQAIDNQWLSLVQTGRTLTIVFANGVSIELLNFFSAATADAPRVNNDSATTTEGAASHDVKVRADDGSKLMSPQEFAKSHHITKTSGAPLVVKLPGDDVGALPPIVAPGQGGVGDAALPPPPFGSVALPPLPMFPPDLSGGDPQPQPPPANHAPIFGMGTSAGTTNEDAAPPAAAGVLAFTDADLTDSHTASATPLGSGYFGAFSAVVSDPATGDGAGEVTWSFAAAAASLQFLAQGQQLVQTYTVSVADGRGGSALHVVTVTIDGLNDAPVVTAADDSADVIEGPLPIMTATGVIDFGDVDLADAHVAAITPAAGGYLGSFAASVTDVATGDGVGRVTWLFLANNVLRQSLGSGQQVVQSYTVEIDDGHGGIASQLVTITITGTNDAAIISGDTTGAVEEAGGIDNAMPGVPIATGDLDSIDVDDPDDLWADVATPTASDGGYGTFIITAVGVWIYTLDNNNIAVQSLTSADLIVDTFTVATIDGTEQQVTVDISGANDAPVASNDFANLIPVQRGGPGELVEIRGLVSLLANDDDVDAGETALLRVVDVGGTSVVQTPGVETAIVGIYGTLFVQADGTYRYVFDSSDPDSIALNQGQIVAERFDYVAANNGGGVGNEAEATLAIILQGPPDPDVPIVSHDPSPYYAFSDDSQSPNAILADLTDVISADTPLSYALVFYSPTKPADWTWLDQSALPVLSADPAAVADADAGTYTALVIANNKALSAVAFTILADNAEEFNITIDASGSDPGERNSGNRSVGDLVIVNDDIAGSVSAGGGDDVMWVRAGTGTHRLDGSSGNDALYGNDGADALDGGGGNNFVSGGGGDDELIAGGGADILMGGAGNDSLTAGGGDDVLMGGDGSDDLDGGGGNDILIGNAGIDTMTGAGGADRFMFGELALGTVDTVVDYRFNQSDAIDLTGLLDEPFGTTSVVGDFVRLVQIGSDIVLQVDVDGTASGAAWEDLVLLDDIGSGGVDSVNVFFEHANHVLTV